MIKSLICCFLAVIVAKAQTLVDNTFSVGYGSVLTSRGPLPLNQKYYKNEIIVQYKSDLSPYVQSNKVSKALAEGSVTDIHKHSRFGSSLEPQLQLSGEVQTLVEKHHYNRFYRLTASNDAAFIRLQSELATDTTIESVMLSPVFEHYQAPSPAPTPPPVVIALVNDPLFKLQGDLQASGQILSGLGLTRDFYSRPGADISWVKAFNDLKGSTARGDIYVFVIDTGKCDHEDFDKSKNFMNYSFLKGKDVTDEFGHSCHVGGTIFAKTNNGVGIAGIADFANYSFLRVLDENGSGNLSDVSDAIVMVANTYTNLKKTKPNARAIINLSLGVYGWYPPMQVAVDIATEAGVIVVAAAGNSARNIKREMFSPSSMKGVISVGATDSMDDHASFSNWGTDVEAPGDPTLSTVPKYSSGANQKSKQIDKMFSDSGYLFASGTSMASPHVVGAIAILLHKFPDLTRDQILVRLSANVDRPNYIYTLNYREYKPDELSRAGGRLNVFAAMEADNLAPAKPLIRVNWVGHSSANLEVFGSGDDAATGRISGMKIFYAEANKPGEVKTVEVVPYLGEFTDRDSIVYTLKNEALGKNMPLESGRNYLLAVQTVDNVGNWSDVSDSVIVKTDVGAVKELHDFNNDDSGFAFEGGPVADLVERYNGLNWPLWTRTAQFTPGNSLWYAGIISNFNYGADQFIGYSGVSDSELVFSTDLTFVRGSITLEFDQFIQVANRWLDLAEVRIIDLDCRPCTAKAYGNGDEIIAEYISPNKSFGFEHFSLDISELAGKRIKIKFRFYASGMAGGIGWLIDNVMIKTDSFITPVPPRRRMGNLETQ